MSNGINYYSIIFFKNLVNLGNHHTYFTWCLWHLQHIPLIYLHAEEKWIKIFFWESFNLSMIIYLFILTSIRLLICYGYNLLKSKCILFCFVLIRHFIFLWWKALHFRCSRHISFKKKNIFKFFVSFAIKNDCKNHWNIRYVVSFG